MVVNWNRNRSPVLTPEALKLNFTNEGGVNGTTRLLKNVMGLWMLQGCRNCWSAQGKNGSYAELVELANREPAFAHLVDPDDELFLASSGHARRNRVNSVPRRNRQHRRAPERTCDAFWRVLR